MENTSERLSKFITYLGITKNGFAKQIGTSSALISKLTTQDVDFRIDILQKIVGKYPYINLQWLLTGVGDMLQENPTGKPNGNPTENPTEQLINVYQRYRNTLQNFYENCSDEDLKKLLSIDIEELKQIFNMYLKLYKTAKALGAPSFIIEKFTVEDLHKDFKALKRSIDSDIKDTHPHLKEGKTLNIISLEDYKSNIYYWNNQLEALIDYMEQYKDFFPGHVK